MKTTYAELAANQYIPVNFCETAGRILIIGNTAGMFGQYMKDQVTGRCCINFPAHNPAANEALTYFMNCIIHGARIDIVGTDVTIDYYRQMFSSLIDMGMLKVSLIRKSVNFKVVTDDKNDYLNFMDNILEKKISYDHVIQNPPYAGSTHLAFLEKGIEIIKESKGKMTIIEPATWLINVRKNGKAKTEYADIKRAISGHVSKVVIENYNKEFNVGLYVPCSITYVDMLQEFDHIEFICCGAKKYVSSLYDCNLVGEYDKIWSIFDKVQKFGDMMKDHIYNEKKSKIDENTWYCKYPEILGGSGASFCGGVQVGIRGGGFKCEASWQQITVGNFLKCYTKPLYHDNHNNISNTLLVTYNSANKPTDKIADCLFDTKEHLENWKHFVFNNKLPLFLNICLTIDQNNNSKDFVPWLVDRQYTDDEINQMFGFTDDEIAFMDRTIKKFERYSPWFKRYMCGKDSVTDEEVQKFIDTL